MKSVTIRDVAREAGVSIATVSRVMGGKSVVSDETRQRIAEAIRKTGYKLPAAADRSLLSEDGFIYYIMRSASINVYSRLLNNQLILAACGRGLRLLSSNIEMPQSASAPFPEEQMLSDIRQAQRTGARGLVISGFSEKAMTPEVLQTLHGLEIPVVLIVRSYSDYSFNRVLTGSERGAFQAAQHMIQAGRRHLLFVGLAGHDGKRSGFLRAVRESGDSGISAQTADVPDDSAQSCAAALAKALQTDPALDGILCVADEFAAHIQHELMRIGKRLPEDVEIIGYNDNLAPFLHPPMSSIRVPVRQIAETAMDLILGQEQDGGSQVAKSVMLDPQLILR